MRHFEDFEIEHMLNGTGNFLMRWRCRRHLRHCEICRLRLARLMDDREFARHLREQQLRFAAAATKQPEKSAR